MTSQLRPTVKATKSNIEAWQTKAMTNIIQFNAV